LMGQKYWNTCSGPSQKILGTSPIDSNTSFTLVQELLILWDQWKMPYKRRGRRRSVIYYPECVIAFQALTLELFGCHQWTQGPHKHQKRSKI
jgi:hypothetical protein